MSGLSPPALFCLSAGLVLFLEGLLYAFFPGAARRLMQIAATLPAETLRLAGLGAAVAGTLFIWAAGKL